MILLENRFFVPAAGYNLSSGLKASAGSGVGAGRNRCAWRGAGLGGCGNLPGCGLLMFYSCFGELVRKAPVSVPEWLLWALPPANSPNLLHSDNRSPEILRGQKG